MYPILPNQKKKPLYSAWLCVLLLLLGCGLPAGNSSTLRWDLDLSDLGYIPQAQTKSPIDEQGRFLLEETGLYIRVQVTGADLQTPLTRLFPQAGETVPPDGKVQLNLDIDAGSQRTFAVLLVVLLNQIPTYYAPPTNPQKNLTAGTAIALDIALEPMPTRILEGTLAVAQPETIKQIRLFDTEAKLFLPWLPVAQGLFTTCPLPVGRHFSFEIELHDSSRHLLQSSLTIETGSSPQSASIAN